MNDIEKTEANDLTTDFLSTLEMPGPAPVDPEAITEERDVVIGSLLFDRDQLAAYRRRPRIRSSSIL